MLHDSYSDCVIWKSIFLVDDKSSGPRAVYEMDVKTTQDDIKHNILTMSSQSHTSEAIRQTSFVAANLSTIFNRTISIIPFTTMICSDNSAKPRPILGLEYVNLECGCC